MDVKKLGRILDSDGQRAHDRREDVRGRCIGYECVHAAVDDRSRRAAEILADEKGTTRTAFLTRAAEFFTRIERVIADNARNHRTSAPSCAAAGVVLGRPASGPSNPANRAFADPPQLMSDVRGPARGRTPWVCGIECWIPAARPAIRGPSRWWARRSSGCSFPKRWAHGRTFETKRLVLF
ncbi:hypothetical protein ACWCQ1_32465 [Streptomyces sp. NPDC002144]